MTQRTTYDRALDLLAFRARSIAELRRTLIQKGESAAQVDAAIVRLQEQKLLDDAEFSRQFARSRATSSGTSRRRILTELARKGVDREVANAAVSDLVESEGVDLSASIHRVAEKKWKTLVKLDERTAKQRLYGFLARRGFDPDEIRDAMSSLNVEAGG